MDAPEAASIAEPTELDGGKVRGPVGPDAAGVTGYAIDVPAKLTRPRFTHRICPCADFGVVRERSDDRAANLVGQGVQLAGGFGTHGLAFLGAAAPHIEEWGDEYGADAREPCGVCLGRCDSIGEGIEDDAPVRLTGTAENEDVAGNGAGVVHRTPHVPKDIAHGRQSPPAHV